VCVCEGEKETKSESSRDQKSKTKEGGVIDWESLRAYWWECTTKCAAHATKKKNKKKLTTQDTRTHIHTQHLPQHHKSNEKKEERGTPALHLPAGEENESGEGSTAKLGGLQLVSAVWERVRK
jgi:hypothetical protein